MALLTKLSRVSIRMLASRSCHSKEISPIPKPVKHKNTATTSYWKPGPYPETEEARRAAAEKYGLHPSEYKPMPKGPYCLGDYPDLPIMRKDKQDPYYPWDIPMLRLNYDEPINAYYDLDSIDADPHVMSSKYTVGQLSMIFVAITAAIGALMYFTRDFKYFRPMMKKQVHEPGVVHYTFEPAK